MREVKRGLLLMTEMSYAFLSAKTCGWLVSQTVPVQSLSFIGILENASPVASVSTRFPHGVCSNVCVGVCACVCLPVSLRYRRRRIHYETWENNCLSPTHTYYVYIFAVNPFDCRIRFSRGGMRGKVGVLRRLPV